MAKDLTMDLTLSRPANITTNSDSQWTVRDSRNGWVKQRNCNAIKSVQFELIRLTPLEHVSGQ